MYSYASNKITGALFLLSLLLVFVAGCSGSAPISSDLDRAADPIPSSFRTGRYVLVNPAGASFHDLATGATTDFDVGGNVIFSSTSPNGSRLAIGVRTASASKLLLISGEEGGLFPLHEGSNTVVYSGHWSPEGSSFAYGYYEPTIQNDRPALGAGDIMIFDTTTGDTRRLGCSASKAVVAWPDERTLVVRATDDLYRVSALDCNTLQTQDVRRWTSITASPDGSYLAYIFRELAFNSATRAYEPDSALFVLPTAGGEGIKIVGDRYRPRHIAWSPDGTEIAFDVRVNSESETRAVSVYHLERAEAAFIRPPSADDPSRTSPMWSPDGRMFSFLENGSGLFVRREGDSFSNLVAVGADQGTNLRRVGWLAAATLVVQDSDNRAWLYDPLTRRSESVGIGSLIPF